MAETTKQEPIKTLEQAREIINRLQSRENRASHEALVAKARIYDLQHFGQPEPKEALLKSTIVTLQKEIIDLVKQRDKYKAQYRALKGPESGPEN